MNKIAQFISIIAHPVLLPTWMFLIFIDSGICRVFNIDTNICLLTVFITTFVMPMIFMFILKKLKVIKSLTMERREDRFIPLIIMVIFLFTIQSLFDDITSLGYYNFYINCNIMLCSIVFWINIYWKISLHSVGWGAFVAALFIMSTISSTRYLPYFLASIIISGVVGSARLYLKSHSESQIYIGFAVGFLLVYILWYFIM